LKYRSKLIKFKAKFKINRIKSRRRTIIIELHVKLRIL